MTVFARIQSHLGAHKHLYAVVLSFVCFLAYGCSLPMVEFQWDALDYWEGGSSFFKNGHFSILNYDRPVRGYAFALVCCGLQWIQRLLALSDPGIVRVFSAFYIALLSGLLLPKVVEGAFGITCRLWQMLLFSLLLFCFWRGYLSYPLTDFFGLFLLLAAIWAMLLVKPGGRMLAAGILMGLSINARPGQAVALLPAVIYLALSTWRLKVGASRSSAVLVVFLAGLGVSFLPQSLINHRHFGTWSPGVVTTTQIERGEYLQLIIEGLTVQKYETNIGQNYPKARARFHDPVGEQIVEEAGGLIKIGGRYLVGQFLRHPLTMATKYWRHLCNGLDVKYATPYVPNIYAPFQLLSWVNYLLLFIALWIVFTRSTKPAWTAPGLLLLSSMALVCAIAIPTKVETRYFLPAYLGLYALVAYYPDFRGLYQSYNLEQKVKVLLAAAAFLLSCSVYSDHVFSLLVKPEPAQSNFRTSSSHALSSVSSETGQVD